MRALQLVWILKASTGRLWKDSGSIKYLLKVLRMLEISSGSPDTWWAESQKNTMLQLIFAQNQSKEIGMVQECTLTSPMGSWEMLEIKISWQIFVTNLEEILNLISMCTEQRMINVSQAYMRPKASINSVMGSQIVVHLFGFQLRHGKMDIKED